MNKHLIYFNYFNDVNYNYLEDESFKMEQRKDPDKLSAKLYDAFYHQFLENIYMYPNRTIRINIGSYQKYDKAQKTTEFGYSYYVIEANKPYKQKHILSIDYIGPSIYWAKEIAELNNDEIKSILETSRTLGGHIVWERGLQSGQKTVNQAKGGECHNGLWDRIDWTLLILYRWYSCLNNNTIIKKKEKIISELKDQYSLIEDEINRVEGLIDAFECSKDWFAYFNDFQGFIDFFKLRDSFVDENYNVIELTEFSPMKPGKYGYRRYIENSLKAIAKRNIILEKE